MAGSRAAGLAAGEPPLELDLRLGEPFDPNKRNGDRATLDVFRSRAEAIAAVHRIVLMRPRAVRTMLDVPAG